jgi:PET Domain
MQQLDNNKIPRLGSVGKKYHDTQLVIQLPRHDLSTDFCRHLKNSSQTESFLEFRKTRDDEALDISRVIASVKENSVSENELLIRRHVDSTW